MAGITGGGNIGGGDAGGDDNGGGGAGEVGEALVKAVAPEEFKGELGGGVGVYVGIRA